MRTLQRNEAAVPRKTLDVLQRKQAAHDAYLRATQRMGVEQVKMLHRTDEFALGYCAALRQFGALVVEESSNDGAQQQGGS